MTSTLDLLIAQVDDPQLRQRLATEYDSLRARTSYGLVFEEHADEAIRIPRARVTRGATVQLTAEPGPHVYKVRSITDGVATLVRSGEAPRDVPVEDLIVARKLGDPVYTGLTPLGEIRQGGDKPAHLVIQGENYHALQTLLYTHEGKVDLIYIDPPYNTGAGDWIYNDRYIGDTDAYRHSKWLAFMDKRLRLAKRLLSPTGVIIAAIDDNEHHRLRLLMDSVFGEKNFISNVVWQGGRKNDSRYVSNGADYMLIYGRDLDQLMQEGTRWREKKPGVEEALAAAESIWAETAGDMKEATKRWRAFLKQLSSRPDVTDAVSRYNSLDENGRPIFTGRDISWPGGGGPRYDVLHPLTQKPVAVPSAGWRYSDPTKLQALIEAGRARFGKDETFGLQGVSFLHELDVQVAGSVFEQDRRASRMRLRSVLGTDDFPFPKDVDVIARWTGIATNNYPDAVVLDFFGGTGTTAEAVMRLNAADNGRRQVILVTNNELGQKDAKRLTKEGIEPGGPEWEAAGVFEKVTRPRIETVVTAVRRDGSALSEPVLDANGKKVTSGITGAQPLEENVIFARLDYLARTNVELGKQFREVALLLYAQAGAIGRVIAERPERFDVADSYAILSDPAHRREFAEAVNEADGVRHAYIVTDDTAQYQGVVALLDESVTPHHLYEDYLVNFAINTGAAL